MSHYMNAINLCSDEDVWCVCERRSGVGLIRGLYSLSHSFIYSIQISFFNPNSDSTISQLSIDLSLCYLNDMWFTNATDLSINCKSVTFSELNAFISPFDYNIRYFGFKTHLYHFELTFWLFSQIFLVFKKLVLIFIQFA